MRIRRNLLWPVGLAILVLALSTFAVLTHAGRQPQDAEFPKEVASENWPQTAPQLIGGAKDWLNTDGKPLQLKKGTVYVIDFWEYTCVNCLRTLPALKSWNARYAKDGLVIIGIHTPEFKFASEHSNVAAAVKKYSITWPVVVDSKRENWNAYHNSFWPRKYFIDSKGQIVADHAGEGGYAETEALIQKLLKEANPNVQLPKIEEETPERVNARDMTPELYAGARGAQTNQHGNIPNFVPGRVTVFKNPGSALEDGRIYVQGSWAMEEESLRHGRTAADLNDKILLRYHARECNAVLKPEGGKPFRVYVTQDGKPVAKTDKGLDIQYDERGGSYLLVDQPRMYRITRNAAFSSHALTLASMSPDFALYSFTFSATASK